MANELGTMFLVGVVSAGTQNCGEGKAGLYTKVEDFQSWILTNIRD